MALYTRQQLLLLLLLAGAAGVGLGVVHWRAANPETVEWLEKLDGEIAASADLGGEEHPVGPAAGARPRERGDRETRPVAASRPPKRQAASNGETAQPLDLNRATLTDLTGLPGVGPVLARRILDARDDSGRFGAVDDLLGIRGIGRAKLDRLRPFVSVTE